MYRMKPLILIRTKKKNAQNRNRTSDTRIFSPLLYQLSYLGKRCIATTLIIILEYPFFVKYVF